VGSTDDGFASPYATGGGGTVLEHPCGAVLLAALLLRHPVLGLGDGFTLREVRFQQGATCPVGDLVVSRRRRAVRRDLLLGVRAGGAAEG
jgi:hypothetical protein